MNESKKKILIVDDEPDLLEYMESILKDNNYDVVSAVNGKSALEKAVEIKPDLITLDIAMPEETGVKAFRKFQENEAVKDIPVIIISTEGSKQRVDEFMSLGAADYLMKPFAPEDIREKLNNIIGETDDGQGSSDDSDEGLDF